MKGLKIFSVSEYVERLNALLYEHDAVVEGEVSEYKVNQQKWIFFKIKDNNAVLECFSTVFRIRVPLEDGMRVRVYGRPGIYARSGKLSMNVEWAEPAGEGALKRAFELLKAELEKEGLFATARKRPMPTLPKTIGVIASRESAAYGDFLKVLQQRFGGLTVYVMHVQVQGAEAVQNIADAFAYFNAHQEELGLDVVALIRGGGSLEDLAAFNSREVAYAVFGSVVPVVVGVGHEQDVSIADFVADLRASTPSNAAELLVPQRTDIVRFVDAMTTTLMHKMDMLHSDARTRIDDAVGALDGVMIEKAHEIDRMQERISLRLNFFHERIIMHQSKIDALVRLMQSFSPKAVLERGYGIIKKGNEVISSIGKLRAGDTVGVELKDGIFDATVI
ncbi:MAG: exodeoxyribonuclease VII large subunit [Candidatus Azambacteria bacterium]|nr:exodeoxyribonuclease VII large subunit [Candidatus Azambacteria bacterium]